MAFPFLLKALALAPQVFDAGKDIYQAVTGKPADVRSEEELVHLVDRLPHDQQQVVIGKVLQVQAQYQQLDTQRFVAMTDGDAEKVRATARPKLALESMRLMLMPFVLVKWMIILACLEWVVESVAAGFGKAVDVPSLFSVFAGIDIAAAWPLAASFLGPAYLCATAVIRKYMGCRERDKALQYEMQAGKPLTGLQATANAASGVAALVNAVRGR